MMSGFVLSIFVGLFATATLDLWALTLNRSVGLPITNWSHVGRWATGLLSGTLRHANIGSAPEIAHERFAGWLTHYIVGIAYAFVYLALDHDPSIQTASLFGLVTVLAPWLILQPCLGIGYFAANSPNPNLTRSLNLLSHLVFGIGLYLGAVAAELIA